MAVKDEIEQRLTTAFAPSVLEVVNESYKHAGHAGDDGSGESHFRIVIRAAAFQDMTPIARHAPRYLSEFLPLLRFFCPGQIVQDCAMMSQRFDCPIAVKGGVICMTHG